MLLGGDSRASAPKVDRNREDRNPISRAQQRVVLEHSGAKVSLGLCLHLAVNEQELGRGRRAWRASPRRPPAASCPLRGRVKTFFVEELHGAEVESPLDLREEQPQEVLQECLQELLEALVVPHIDIDEELSGRPPWSPFFGEKGGNLSNRGMAAGELPLIC